MSIFKFKIQNKKLKTTEKPTEKKKKDVFKAHK